jgi:post-segregation antitoxin (ccd killing protein)
MTIAIDTAFITAATTDLLVLKPFIGSISAQISTVDTVDIIVSRLLTAVIPAAIATAQPILWVAKIVLFSGSIDTVLSTTIARLVRVGRLVANISTETSTSIPAVKAVRPFVATIPAATTTAEVDLWISYICNFVAAIAATHSVSSGRLFALRPVTGQINASISSNETNYPRLFAVRPLTASISSSFATAEVDLWLSFIKQFVGQIACGFGVSSAKMNSVRNVPVGISSEISTTASADILAVRSFAGTIVPIFSTAGRIIVARPFVNVVAASFSTTSAARVAVMRPVIAEINSVFSISIPSIKIIRPIVASIQASMTTADADLWTAKITVFVASIETIISTSNARIVSNGFLRANIAAGMSTSQAIDLLVSRSFTATIPAAISTMDAVLWLSYVRDFTVSIGVETSVSSGIDLSIMRLVVGQINATMTSSSARANVSRPFTASVSGIVTTDLADLWISFIRLFTGSVYTSLSTASARLPIVRPMSNSIAVNYSTTEPALWAADIRSFAASISANLSTSTVRVAIERAIIPDIHMATSTSVPRIYAGRAIGVGIGVEFTGAISSIKSMRPLIAAVTTTINTSDPDVLMAGNLSAGISARTSTSIGALKTVRSFAASINASTTTSQSTLWLSYILDFVCQLNAAITTRTVALTKVNQVNLSAVVNAGLSGSLANLLTLRKFIVGIQTQLSSSQPRIFAITPFAASISAIINPGISKLEVYRPSISDIDVQFETSQSTAHIANNFAGIIGTKFDSSISDINTNRIIAALIQSEIRTNLPTLKRLNSFTAVMAPAFDSSAADLFAQRRIQSIISSLFSTNSPKTNLIRPISATIPASITTSQINLWTSGIKTFLAVVSVKFSTKISKLDNRAKFASSILTKIETDQSDINIHRSIPISIQTRTSVSMAKTVINRILSTSINYSLITDDIRCDIGWLGKIDHPAVATLSRLSEAAALSRSYESVILYRNNLIAVLENHEVAGTIGNSLSVSVLNRNYNLNVIIETLSGQIQ